MTQIAVSDPPVELATALAATSLTTAGLPGLSDRMNRHPLQLWGLSVLISAITTASMLSTTSTYGGLQATRRPARRWASLAPAWAAANLNTMLQQIRLPIEVRQGTTI